MTLEQHVQQSTMIHPDWNELDHAEYLINEVGFDGALVQGSSHVIMNTMLETRGQMLRRKQSNGG